MQIPKPIIRLTGEKIIAKNATIVVTGCYAQLKPKEIAQIPGVSVVVATKEKFNLISSKAYLSGHM